MRLVLVLLHCIGLIGQGAIALDAIGDEQEWSVPAAGNAFRTLPDPNHRAIDRDGALVWSDPAEVYSIYFHLDRPASIGLALEARVREGQSKINVRIGETVFSTAIRGAEFAQYSVGTIEIEQPGYVRVDLQGTKRGGAVFAELKGLIIRSETDGAQLTCVATNEGNMFYWGRRGPSVHLRYDVPRDLDLEYAYSEITVAEGDDAIGSYFMANGFSEGYFGFQVNGDAERRVLFSVWSPFQTDNPKAIPEDQRVQLLGRGPDVKTGEFGNEGSGGQSFLVYPWRSGRTYRFLTQVTPNTDGTTDYTSWFGDKQADEWRLIASFRRPKTTTYLRGFHSFLENFNAQTGHISRCGQYTNVWVCDKDGKWHECLNAQFSVDATGGGGHRLDFAGGAEGPSFFLRNCGFFHDQVRAGAKFTRTSTAVDQPNIEFGRLPRK